MSNVILKRVLIISTALLILLGLSLVSDESLLLNLPSDLEIINILASEREQRASLIRSQKDYLEQQTERLEYYKTQLEAQQDYINLELIEQEEERLKEIEEELKNEYTLNNRDKPQDYQNLFDDSIKHTFVIDFDRSEWQHLLDSMTSYFNMYGTFKSNEYVKADVSYYGNEEFLYIPDVGIRTKGNDFSRQLPEDGNGNIRPVHYVMKFNETFNEVEGTLEYDWLKTREVFDLEKLAFKWNRNNDASYMNELYAHRLFQEAGVAMPQITLTKLIVKIDGVVEMTELYSAQEYMDEEYIRRYFQEVPTDEVGDLYKVIWPGTLEPLASMSMVGIRDWRNNIRPTYGKETNQKNNDYSSLIDFTRDLNNYTGVTLKNFLDDNFDVDMFIRSMAANVLLGNPDDYRGNANNYYLYFDEEDYLTYIPFDYDHCMGVGWAGATTLVNFETPVFINYTIGNDIYQWNLTSFTAFTENTPLVDKVLEFDDYRILYEDYLEEFITEGYFSYTYYNDLFNTLENHYGDEFSMVNDKSYYINAKTNNVLNSVAYHRSLRD